MVKKTIEQRGQMRKTPMGIPVKTDLKAGEFWDDLKGIYQKIPVVGNLFQGAKNEG